MNNRHLLFERACSCIGLKFVLAGALNALTFGPYWLLQRFPVFAVTSVPSGPIDRLIPFSPAWAWVYLSIYLLMPLAPLFMNHRRTLLRYALGILMIGASADLVFFLWPTCCPRPPLGDAGFPYRQLVALDLPLHAFPSLHAAFAVFSTLCLQRILGELPGFNLWRAGFWLWTTAILFATLLTKQHVLIDIIAGSGLGLAAYACVFKFGTLSDRESPSPAPNSTRSQPSLPTP